LDHVVPLRFTVDEEIKADLLLEGNDELNLLLDEGLVLVLGDFTFAQLGTSGTNLLGLGKDLLERKVPFAASQKFRRRSELAKVPHHHDRSSPRPRDSYRSLPSWAKGEITEDDTRPSSRRRLSFVVASRRRSALISSSTVN